MGDEKIQIVATARDQASPVLKKLQANVTALGSKGRGPLGGLLGGLGSISPAALGASFGIGILSGALADGVAGALAEDKQMARLAATLRANVKDWDGSTAAIEAFNGAAMDLAFSDNDARESMIKLITATGNVTNAMTDARLAMDIARGRGIDLAEATDIVAKAAIGNTKALKAMGIEVKAGSTATEILAELQKRFAGQADAYASTTAGKFEAAQTKVNNTMEDFGHWLINDTAGLLGFSDAMKGNKQAALDFLSSASDFFPGGPFLKPFVDNLQQGIDKLAHGMTGAQALSMEELLAPSAKPAAKTFVDQFAIEASNEARRSTALARTSKAFADRFSDDLAGDLRGNKGVVKSALHDIMWALNHPQALERQLAKLKSVLEGPKLAQLLGSDNPMQQAIGQQVRDRLTGQFQNLTGTTYLQGVTSIVGAINSLRGSLNLPTSLHYIPPIPGVSPTTVTPTNTTSHGHPVVMDGRIVAKLIDERLGRNLSLAPAGVVQRG